MSRIIVAHPVCRCAPTPADAPEVIVLETDIDYNEACQNEAFLQYDGETVGDVCQTLFEPVEDMINCLNEEYTGLAVFEAGVFPNVTITITVPIGNDPNLYNFLSSQSCE